MAIGYQVINNGTVLGDHTGDDGRTFTQKCKEMFAELFNQATNSYLAATVTAASTDDYDPWGANPPQDFLLDINPSTNDIILTSLARGRDGLRGMIRNIGTGGFGITLSNAASTGTAANKFYGSNDAGAVQGGYIALRYCSLPNPRWYIG